MNRPRRFPPDVAPAIVRAMNVLVVGGAGYVGSHCTRRLLAAGHRPVVLDNLCFGHRAAVPENVPFQTGDLGDRTLVARLLETHAIDAVMHFAAFLSVPESVRHPLRYYENNVAKTISLLQAMNERGVRRFVFSSSCATYGVPEQIPIAEDAPQHPINPYGQTKLDVETLLRACARAHGLSFAAFRYFNAAGAAVAGAIGEDHDPEIHLIPLAIGAATGRRGPLQVFGRDYPTPDGTCLRDYVHVDDIARAHVAVLDRLAEPGRQLFYNLGTGQPASVLDVIHAVERTSGLTVPFESAERRAGDPPALYADASKAHAELGWTPRFPALDAIVETAWRWHRDHPNGFADRP